MFANMSKPGSVDIHLWSPEAEVEPQAMRQLENIAALPWVFHHVAVMPDVHYGKGATVGSVVAMKNAVSPAAVGVDIGCGMGAIKTNLRASDLPDNLEALRSAIEAKIPVGFNAHATAAVPSHAGLFAEFSGLSEKVQDLRDRALRQLGTLGGGNHFIELCVDTKQSVWMMLHSGSRNIGKTLAEIHMSVAKTLVHNADLPDPDLAVFLSGTPEMSAYRNDLFWAQRYAMENRSVMFNLYEDVMQAFFPSMVDFDVPILCHHNYVSEERHFGQDVIVTRKGAIRAGRGEMGIIPGSMGTKSYIVRGLGNIDSFESASHGAGRLMSRGAAKRKFTVADLEAQTVGVCCRKDADVVDEIPGAYKPIEDVMKNQLDLVEVVAELKQVLCVKG
jgi:tRNA-splicing ligase RtcB (3'-phosphate/5'-hydroxy nucleic acid ligase)